MNPFALQKKIGFTCSATAALMAVLNFSSSLFFHRRGLVASLIIPTTWSLLAIAFAVFLLSRFDHDFLRHVQAIFLFLLSGPTLMGQSDAAFFGFWFIISGVFLLYKYSFFRRFGIIKASMLFAWAIFWIAVYLIRNNLGTPVSAITVFLFLIASLAILYFAFEEEIRELVKINTKKDSELEKQKAIIDQMEPLSVLGERVSHVAHSFKNNLTQLSAAVYYLEHGKDPERAAERIRTFAVTMSDRIDNILMIAHSGAKLEPEILDLGRVLDGVKLIYLEEKNFLQHASYRLRAEKEVFVRAVRWDLLLLLENVLKNAIEAIIEKGIYGRIDIDLTRGMLRIANNGGAMPQCFGCPGPASGSCLSCPRIGRPGNTTKKKGSGTGMGQVIQALRDQGWDLRIENQADSVALAMSFPALEAPKDEKAPNAEEARPAAS